MKHLQISKVSIISNFPSMYYVIPHRWRWLARNPRNSIKQQIERYFTGVNYALPD